MTAYRMWTLTCDVCGEIYDDGQPDRLATVKANARRYGWRTGRRREDEDLCPAHGSPNGGANRA